MENINHGAAQNKRDAYDSSLEEQTKLAIHTVHHGTAYTLHSRQRHTDVNSYSRVHNEYVK